MREAAARSAVGTVETQNPREWADVMWDVYGGLEVVTQSEQPCAGAMVRRSIDRLHTLELRLTPQTHRRTASMVESHPSDDVFVAMITEGQALVVQDGRSCTLGPGDFAFVESSRPYSAIYETSSRLIDFAWPRHAIGLSESECQSVTARAFRAASPLGRWLSPALIGLHQMDEGVSQAGVVRIADGISDLLVTAALELASPDDPTDRWRPQYDQMIKFIERNLDETELTADFLAENFFMSTRSVHRLFAKFDTTVASAIRDMRLEEARRMMLSHSHRTKSVSFIASHCGFSSLQVFSRAFTTKYGVGPKQYRDSHQ
ncbi:helix-turn-helix domain-containing protein [Saccharopolyspora karakumensis]|nr:helix-turn-helix domain-containing protein [Saccharopolyspora karakumensis]